jgi:hypothetical protein
MDPLIVDRVTGWETVTGRGAGDLPSLARDEFSGAVTAGAAWAFLLNGRVVGLFDGTLEDFEGGDVTVYRAPDPALPLLFAMQETGGETRAKYYSEETSLREVDRTLSSGKFTGYVELSENVLSGDYYVVYHGGRSMSVAYVGASERLVTGDEAFDRAADEVGIYAVNAVEVTVTDLPDGAGRGDVAGADGDSAEAGGVEAVDDSAEARGVDADAPDQESVTFGAAADESAEDPGTEAATGPDPDPDRYDGLTGGMGIGLNSDEAAEPSTADAPAEEGGERDEGEGGHGATDATDEDTFGDVATGEEADEADATDGTDEADEPDRESEADEVDEPDREAEADDGSGDVGHDTEAVGTGLDSASTPAVREESTERKGEATAEGPSAQGTDPTSGDTDADTDDSEDAVATTNGEAAEHATDADPVSAAEPTPEAAPEAGDGEPAETEPAGADESGAFSAERQWQQTRRIPALSPDESLEREAASATAEGGDEGATDTGTEATDSQRKPAPGGRADAAGSAAPMGSAADASELQSRLERVRAERDELASNARALESDLESVTRERDRLRARVADLESELSALREATTPAEGDAGHGDEGQRLSPAAAREGTNLFVRYRSKGQPTLKKAQAGEAKQSAVVENLRLEYHTTFESDETTVDGEPYEAFLYGTTEWQFTKWVVEELLYEIGRSGHRVDLAPLFDRIPKVDRIEFDGAVPVTVDDEESQRHESRTFDLVFWDSMGDPLFVVDVDTSRNATTQEMVGSLIDGARAVGESKDTLGGAFSVTTSFFEPGALDAVGEATKSGLLSRSSKKSFVKLSRKQGYHLCLVEARDGEFHLTVPEL